MSSSRLFACLHVSLAESPRVKAIVSYYSVAGCKFSFNDCIFVDLTNY